MPYFRMMYSSMLAYMVDANVGRSSGAVATSTFFRGILAFISLETAVPMQVWRCFFLECYCLYDYTKRITWVTVSTTPIFINVTIDIVFQVGCILFGVVLFLFLVFFAFGHLTKEPDGGKEQKTVRANKLIKLVSIIASDVRLSYKTNHIYC